VTWRLLRLGDEGTTRTGRWGDLVTGKRTKTGGRGDLVTGRGDKKMNIEHRIMNGKRRGDCYDGEKGRHVDWEKPGKKYPISNKEYPIDACGMLFVHRESGNLYYMVIYHINK